MATAAKKKAAAKPAPAKKTARVRASVVEETSTPARGRVKVLSDDEGDDEGLGQAASTYFSNMEEKEGLEFVSAGAAVIDCMLGGGWALGRVVNIVGDRSAGKTLLAIEACANFHMSYPDAPICYAESEAAFDEAYAEALGMPVKAVDFAVKKKGGKGEADEPLRTIEDWYENVKAFIAKVKEMPAKKGGPRGLYILDSLDALSDDAEQAREIGEASYGGSKPKKLGELFRRLVQDLEDNNILLIVVSQLRDKLNVTFGEKQTRSGGRALDFYASHIVWLAEIGKLLKTMSGIERVIGVKVKARVKKNKVGLPFRDCQYPILFGYGVDDLTANVEWLIEAGREELLKERVGMSKAGYKVRVANLRDKGGDTVREVRAELRKLVQKEWQTIEQGFLPKSRKY
jgi:recombination protein RecA